MYRKYKILFAWTACLMTSGCVPQTTTCYRPEASSGTAISGTCGAMFAPKDTIKFELGTVKLQVTGGAESLMLALAIPKGSAVNFASSEVIVRSGARTLTYNLSQFSYYDRTAKQTIQVPIREVLIGEDEKFVFGVQPRIFDARLAVAAAGANSYVVQLPVLSIDGKALTVPPISFTKDSGFGLYAINC